MKIIQKLFSDQIGLPNVDQKQSSVSSLLYAKPTTSVTDSSQENIMIENDPYMMAAHAQASRNTVVMKRNFPNKLDGVKGGIAQKGVPTRASTSALNLRPRLEHDNERRQKSTRL